MGAGINGERGRCHFENFLISGSGVGSNENGEGGGGGRIFKVTF